MSAETLAAAGREVAEREKAGTCTPPTLSLAPSGLMGLSELNAERERRHQEAAKPAA